MKIDFMRKLLPIIFLWIAGFLPSLVQAQCQGGTSYGTIVPTTTWQTSLNVLGGEYVRFNATAGTVYEFSFCSSDGGWDAYDTEISMTDDLGTYIGAYNDDDLVCALSGGGFGASKLRWTAPSTGFFRVVITELGCFQNSTFGTNLAYRIVPCTTPAVGGTAVASRANMISNDSIRFTLTGYTGTIDWEYYFNVLPWNSSGSSAPSVNFFVTAQNQSTVYARARLVNGGCSAYSNTVSVNIGCAVPFNDPCNVTLDYINNVTFNTINNNSTYNSNTAYQFFPNATTTVCRGSIYPISISSTGVAQGRTAWIDYNNDGDFDDAGENVLAPTAPSTLPSTGNITIPMGATLGTVKMRVVSVAGITPNVLSCASTVYPSSTNLTDGGEFEEYNITISGSPTATAGANQTICTNSVIMAANAPSAGTGTWSVVTGAGTFTDANLNTTNVTGIGQGVNTFLWTVTTTGCGSATSSVTILNNSPSQSVAGNPITTCVPTVGNMAATAPLIGSGSWSVVSGSGTFTFGTSPTTAVTGVGPGLNVYMWTTTNAGCTSTSTVTVSFGPPSNSVAGASQTICGTSAILAANVPSVGTGNWSLINGNGIFADPTDPATTVTGINSGINTYRWTITNTCGSSTSDVIIQNDGPTPSVAGSNQTICMNDSTQMLANNPTVGTGVWTLVSGNGNIVNPNSPTTNITGMTVGANVFRWTTSTMSCSSTSDVTLTVDSTMITSNAGTDQFTCGTSVSLSANAPGTGSGLWGVVTGSGTFSAPTNENTTVTGLTAGINTFTWTINNGGCSKADTVNITIEVLPTGVDAGPDQSLCPQTTLLAASSPGTGTGVWSVSSGTGSFTNPADENTTVSGLAIGLNTLRWTVSNTCGSAFDEVDITVGQFLPSYSAGSNQSVCTDTAKLSASVPFAGTTSWSFASGSGNFDLVSDAGTVVRNLSPGQNELVWTVSYGICITTDTVVIDYLEPATISNAGSDFQVCTTTATLNANTPVIGQGSWLLLSGTGTFQDPTDPNTQVSNLGTGSNIFRWYITNGNCYVTYDEVTVFRGVPPSTSIAGNDILTCNTIEIMNGNIPSVGTGTWSVIYGPVTIVNPHQHNAQILGIVPGDSVVLKWTITNGGCNSDDSLTIRTILPAIANFTPNISGVNVTFNNLSTSATGYQWSFGDGNFSSASSPTHTYLAYGTYQVRLVAFNACKSDTVYQTITIGTTGIENASEINLLELYPNPALAEVFFTLPVVQGTLPEIEVQDLTGRTISLPAPEFNEGKFRLNTENLAIGTYLIRIRLDGKTYSGKLLRQ